MGKNAKKKDYEQMPIVNKYAAGIDLGSRLHVACVLDQGEAQLKEFGTYTSDLEELCNWLLSYEITSVAIESTGIYWQPLYRMLLDYGLEVVLVKPGQYKRDKKTDYADAQWLQKLHSMGLLSGSHVVDNNTEVLQQYWRYRQDQVSRCGDCVRRLQKVLRQMNICLEVVVSNIVGSTGLKILESILSGERDVKRLASYRHGNIKASEEEIEKALRGDWREVYLELLRVHYEEYQFHQSKIVQMDKKIEAVLERYTGSVLHEQHKEEAKEVVIKKKRSKNSPSFNIQHYSYALFGGVDLSRIPGVSHGLLMTLLCEVGPDLSKFKSSGAFTQWLRLTPNNKISGGKLNSSKSKRTRQRLSQAFKDCANTVGNSRSGDLSGFFKRIAYRKGRGAAIYATARKIAVIVWNMLTKKEAYNYRSNEVYEQKIRIKQINNIQKHILRLQLKPEDLVFQT